MKNIINKLFLLIVFILSCKTKTYNSYYYLLFPYFRKGFQQPEKVEEIQIQYIWEVLSIEITWKPSTDPDTNSYVPYYFIYLYFEYPTRDLLYDKKFLLDITSDTKYFLFLRNFRGILYFMITAYDLGAESPPSEIIEFRVPQ